jgi:hypothetical protein
MLTAKDRQRRVVFVSVVQKSANEVSISLGELIPVTK